MSAKNEERRQTELRKRQDYLKQTTLSPTPKKLGGLPTRNPAGSQSLQQAKATVDSEARRCYKCDKIGHLAKDCRVPRTESSGRGGDRRRPVSAKQVQATQARQKTQPASKAGARTPDPLSFL